MKKFLTIATVAVFVLTMAAVTYAAEINIDGYFRTRTALGVNVETANLDTTPTGVMDDTEAWVDSRARLGFNAVASENLMGRIQFEVDSTWGDGVYSLGAGGVDLETREAMLKFTVPGTENFPTTAQVGLHGVYLGRFSVDDQAPGVTIDTKVEPAEIRLTWFKHSEGDTVAADDVDTYGARVTVPFGDLRLGGHFAYSKYGKGGISTVGAPTATSSSSGLYWIGGTVDGKAGPVSFVGDFVYNGGKVDYSVPVGTVDEDKYGGWVGHVKASMPVGEMYEVGGLFMYASGDDKKEVAKGNIDGWREHPGGTAFHPTVVYFSSGVNDSFGFNSHVGPSPGSSSFAGDWLLQAFASAKPLDWLKVTLLGAYIGDNVDNGDRIGTATDSTGALEDNSDTGIELDALADISIYKELTFKVGAGLLFAGDALDQGTATPGVNKSPDDPWAIVSQLIYKW